MNETRSKVLDVAADVAALTTTKPRPPNAGKGRIKGVPNKNTKAIKDMILGALSDAGGQEYLARQAEENPAAFMGLIGKVLPTELKGQLEGGFTLHVTTGVTRD